jgi:hypothetical protein
MDGQCRHGTRLGPTIYCIECVTEWQRARSRSQRQAINGHDSDLETRLYGIDSIGHDGGFYGTHSHGHLAHDGPDSDHDGVHAHPHIHSGEAGHGHVHAPGLRDSIYDMADAAANGTPVSSSHRGPRGASRSGRRPMEPLSFPASMSLNEQLTAAEELVEQTEKDWSDAIQDMRLLRSHVQLPEMAHARVMHPAERHAWTAAMLAEGRAQACDRAYHAALALRDRLQREWDAVSRFDMLLPPGREVTEITAIRGNRSLFGTSDPPSGRGECRIFEYPGGLGARDREATH